MPELPDIVVYVEALRDRIVGRKLDRIDILGPFVLRSTTPQVESVEGRTVQEVRRVGKRIAIGFENDLWLVLHLMIAGRLRWQAKAAKKGVLAILEFDSGTLLFTEAGTQHRASLHVAESLQAFDPGGLEVLEADLDEFAAALRSENHTLKRALTDPRLLSGIGNAYSDEILHEAKLSPVMLTHRLKPYDCETLFTATRHTLGLWIERLRAEAEAAFPEKVTAFRKEMAVHGRYGKPCLKCGEKIQRIRYADNETNYCAQCQTGGKVLADRGLSRLLGPDWPRTLEELEALKRPYK